MQNPGPQEPLAARSSGVSPRAALVVLAALLAAGGLYWLLASTRPEVEVVNSGINEESTEIEMAPLLSPSEAKAEFKRLYAGLVSAIESRDLSQLEDFATLGGTAYENGKKAIRNHLSDGVIERSKYTFRELDVQSLTDSTIRLLVKSFFYPCFVTETGRDVTEGPRAVNQVMSWKVKLIGEREWLLDSGDLKKYEAVTRAAPNC